MSQPSENPLVRAHLDVIERLWTDPVLEGCESRWPTPEAATVMLAESRCGAAVKRWHSLLPDQTRLMALDSSSSMLDEARGRLGEEAASQIFFVKQQVRSLSYADDVFDAAACIHGMVTARQAHEGMAEMVRVIRSGATLLMAAPILGSFPQLFDLLVEALRAEGMEQAIPRLMETEEQLLTPARLKELGVKMGLESIDIHQLEWTVAFDGGREYVYSPLVRETFFPHWLGAIRAEDRDRVLGHVSRAMDIYWDGEAIEAPVRAVLFQGQKPGDET